MKRWITLILLPLVLSQGIAMPQAEPQNLLERQVQPSPVSTTSTTRPQPGIIPLKGTDQIQLQLVNCNWIIDCAITNLLLPASTRIDQLQLQFDNPALLPAQIFDTATVVQGNFTRYQLTNTFSVCQGAQTLAANEIVRKFPKTPLIPLKEIRRSSRISHKQISELLEVSSWLSFERLLKNNILSFLIHKSN